ncbi:MAG TPA: T9SS type A sorting domain-containing protein [Brumimicrobium sp.]|nr:T9SS type A sorting domain-containing protein [Brumimicrobium sp.]
MRFLSLILFFTVSLGIYAQDGISPITANPDLFGKKKLILKSLSNSFDSTIVYVTDTLTLPFFDDFSKNNFQKYETNIGDASLTEEQYYRMLDVNSQVPLADGTKLTDTKTYRSEYDPILDTTILYYFDSIVFLYDDLAVYAPNYLSTFAYPNYILIDTLDGSGDPADTLWIDADYEQASAIAFIKNISDPTKFWLNEQAYHNYRFSVNPWSLGVVTFDGLDEYGYPYNFGGITNQVNDILLAKPMDLSGYSPADSVYFSFLYQKEGFGDKPEMDKDSLFVEFYSPVTGTWKRVWRTNGGALTDFQVAHIPLTNVDYFQKGFQFRFGNYSSPAGALDHFHIDYVHLRDQSGYQDTLFKDFALVYPISTLLKDYTSVPWKHYRANHNDKMSDSVKFTVRNGSELTENNLNGLVNVYHEGNLEGSFTLNASTLSGGDINYGPRTTYESYHDFSTGYFFDSNLTNDTLAYFDYLGTATAQFPNNPVNDTTFGRQVFENYYSYDDGTAEKAYGITGVQSLLAVKYDAYQADSLIGVQIHFVPTVIDLSNDLFLLTVWDDNDGKPGDVIYEDEFYYPRQPIYTNGRNEFHTYVFKDTMKVGVGETFYVGMRQIDEDRLSIGFDANHDNADKTFWSVNGGGNWYNANYPGSVMIRPIVSSLMDYTLGIETNELVAVDYDFTIYPNPTRSVVNIRLENTTNESSFQILDLNGRVIKEFTGTSQVDVSTLQSGIYLVNRIEQKQVVKVKKLVVQ